MNNEQLATELERLAKELRGEEALPCPDGHEVFGHDGEVGGCAEEGCMFYAGPKASIKEWNRFVRCMNDGGWK